VGKFKLFLTNIIVGKTDIKYLEANIHQSLFFSKIVLVSYMTKLFNGEKYDYSKIDEIRRNFNGVLIKAKNFQDVATLDLSGIHFETRIYFIEHEYIESVDANLTLGLMRKYAFDFSNFKLKSTFFLSLDADEIPRKFLFWILTKFINFYHQYDAIAIKSFYYLKSCNYRAIEYQVSGIIYNSQRINSNFFIEKSLNSHNKVFRHWDRAFIYFRDCRFKIIDFPLIHHFSWVHNIDDLKSKTKTWGHTGERDWEKIINLVNNFKIGDEDPVNNFSYRKVSIPRFCKKYKIITD
jgi:hypothetical protein